MRSLRWADGLLGDGQSHLVLADSRPFRRGELVAAWWGDGAHQGWRTLHIEDVDEGGVRRAIWLRSGKRVSNQIRRLLSAGHMRCLRCLPVAEDEEDEEEEEEEEEQGSEGSSAAGSAAGSSEGGLEGSSAAGSAAGSSEGGSEGGGSAAGGSEGSSAAGLAGGSEGGQTREEVVSIDDRAISCRLPPEPATTQPADATTTDGLVAGIGRDREEADMITEGGMQVDSRYWCVDAPVDWGRLEAANADRTSLVLPDSLEKETAEFRAEVVSRAQVVDSNGPLAVRSPFTLELVIAAVLTTQCRNGRSVLVFRELVAIAREEGSWARVTFEAILRLVTPLGFPRTRARNVFAATRV